MREISLFVSFFLFFFSFVRPPVRSNGRSSVLPVMFFSSFFRHAFSEFPRPIALKLCPLIGIWLNFIMQVQKLGGTPPKKFRDQKYAKFRSILDHLRLWSRISPERERLWICYPKSENVTNYGNSSCVWWKKSGELWPTNGLKLHVSLDPLKCTFWQTIFQPIWGAAHWIFLHALEIDQALIAHTRSGTGVPQKNLIVKIWNLA